MTLPADLASNEAKTVYFFRDEVEAADAATAALLGDLRFEHLDHAEDKVRRFMAECWADRSTDHVPLFVASHSAEVRKATCFIPVEFLSVTSVREFPGVRLLPVDVPQIPRQTPGFILEKPTGCVAAVEVEGTSLAKMADRARAACASSSGPCASLSPGACTTSSSASVLESDTPSTTVCRAGTGAATTPTS